MALGNGNVDLLYCQCQLFKAAQGITSRDAA